MENEITKSLALITTGKKFAIGNDLVFVPDFATSLNDLFKKKVYTATEIKYCNQFDNSMLRYASTWAGKEAVYKALKQLDESALGWKKIEIVRKQNAGEPQVVLHGQPKTYKISLTISHDGEYVWAIALIDANL